MLFGRRALGGFGLLLARTVWRDLAVFAIVCRARHLVFRRGLLRQLKGLVRVPFIFYFMTRECVQF